MSSGTEVDRLLDQLEAILAAELPEAEAIATWKAAFDAAVARADRGPGWEKVLVRADALGTRLQGCIQGLQVRMARLTEEASVQDAGARALKGYGSTTRG
jgi:hypothetical protein